MLREELFFGQRWSNVTLYLERSSLKICHLKKNHTSVNQVGI